MDQSVFTPGELPSPPRPRLAFRVGIVGHRPNRLQQADLPRLADTLRGILDEVRAKVLEVKDEYVKNYDGHPPILRALSPLAEGVDRLFAEKALALGYELCCVMPFAREEYERDFAPEKALETDSSARFASLLAKAATRFELDGQRGEAEPTAYGAAGQVVLNQSDLLIVVWDGERQNKRGGTEETFDAARRQGVPVVWVDAHAPHDWQCLAPGESQPRFEEGERAKPTQNATEAPAVTLRKFVVGSLDLPPGKTGEDNPKCLERFYRQTRPRWSSAVVWSVFQSIVGKSKWPVVRWKVPPFEQAVSDEWPRNQDTALNRMINRLRPCYAWPDKLSEIYGNRYRSAFILAFLVAAFAVAMALLPLGLGFAAGSTGETLSTLLEMGAILFILLLVVRGRMQAWHTRWLEYRFVAELVRHLRLVAPLGGQRPYAQVPAHLASYGEPSGTWMDWYVRAVARDIGLPDGKADLEHVKNCLADLHELIVGQLNYHKAVHTRSHRIEHRLHLGGMTLIALTLIACGLHLAHALLPTHILTFACGFFPALGAALAGIENQGEFRRVARRSEAMAEHLERLETRVEAFIKQIASYPNRAYVPEASVLANEAATLLVAEVLDWRVVFLDRPIEQAAQ